VTSSARHRRFDRLSTRLPPTPFFKSMGVGRAPVDDERTPTEHLVTAGTVRRVLAVTGTSQGLLDVVAC
jgi:hypothetical protein